MASTPQELHFGRDYEQGYAAGVAETEEKYAKVVADIRAIRDSYGKGLIANAPLALLAIGNALRQLDEVKP